MKTACAYIRVSTDMQTEHSPEAQKRLIFDYCQNNDILITNDDFYEDLGISGTKADKRPRFNDMIANCKSKDHPYDCVLVWKFSRFARNQEESIVYKRLLKKNNVEVISISEPLPEGFVGELVERIFEWMDEYYSINLSGEVMRGMTQKAMKGGYLGSQPMGYAKPIDRDTPPAIIEDEAKIVKLIFNYFLEEGQGISSTVRYLNSSNIKTRNGNAWERRSVQYLLENPFYIGKTRWNYGTHKGYRKTNPESEWIIADGSHEPIISNEQFELVQDKLKILKRPSEKGIRVTHSHFLSGILKCKTCGGSMCYHKGIASRNQSAYFICRNYQSGLCQDTQYTIVSVMENYFYEAMENAINNDQFVINSTQVEFDDNSYWLNQLKQLDNKEKRIKQAYRDGIDTLEEYKDNKKLIQEEREKIMARCDQNKTNEQSHKQSKQQVMNILEILKSNTFSESSKNEALRKVLSKIIYSKKEEVFEMHFS